MPRPVSTSASSGSAAASPHTPTGLPLADAALATISIMRSSAGCQGSFSAARLAECRSAAKAYWARSLVPMLSEVNLGQDLLSLYDSRRSFDHDADGSAGPRLRAAWPKLRTSSTVAIIGAMTQTSADSASAASLIAFS